MNLKSIFFLFLLIPLNLLANTTHSPKNFKFSDGMAVFTDFKKGEYNIAYNPNEKSAQAISKISFETSDTGMPLFDLYDTPTRVILDGKMVTSKLIKSSDGETSFRVILQAISPGPHVMEIASPITQGINFSPKGVSAAFWFNDLQDRGLLEAYLPANLEHDQYKMIFNIDFKTLAQQKIYTNGMLTWADNNRARIEFPETYTSSSIYFHTTPIGRYPEINFHFQSTDARDIPITIYSENLSQNMEKLKNIVVDNLIKLEAQYGPFLHNTLTIFIAGNGGMEYCGATMTELSALHHELTHSYFGRGGFMPANGNAGWIDEAITTWSSEGTEAFPDIDGVGANMAGNSPYRRYTPMSAYSQGRDFIGYLHYKFQKSSGLLPFLNKLIRTEFFKPMTTEEFTKKISDYFKEDLSPLFKNHVYSNNLDENEIQTELGQTTEPHKVFRHTKMSIKDMAKFL